MKTGPTLVDRPASWFPSVLTGCRSPATAAAAATTPATAATAAATVLGDVDLQVAAVERRTIHGLHGLGGIVGAVVRHETEAARTARLPIGDDLGLTDFTIGLEGIAETVVIRIPAEATDKKLVGHFSLFTFCVPEGNAVTPGGRRHLSLGSRSGVRDTCGPLSESFASSREDAHSSPKGGGASAHDRVASGVVRVRISHWGPPPREALLAVFRQGSPTRHRTARPDSPWRSTVS